MITKIRNTALGIQAHCTPATTPHGTQQSTPRQRPRWSAEQIRSQLGRSFSRLCALSTSGIPSPWADVEITEE